jgi:Flp pilus assembly protein TadD
VEVETGQDLPSEPEKLLAEEAIERGIQHLGNDEVDRAIECFTEAIRLNSKCVRAYRLRGQIYEIMGEWAKAERDIAKARRVEPRMP